MNVGPLPDLHRHLDGSLRPSTVRELAARKGVAVPPDLPFRQGMGLAAALERFRFTLSLLDTADAVRRVAREICEDAAAEGVTTLEVRFAPQL
ncbi:MAG TPA: adenosine deaminase, partial [Planctomycetota bacterium]|nr:adenosine deaminase [Planctomycetota bacterium]